MFEFLNRIPPLVRVSLRYAAIAGVLGFILVIILYYIGRHPMLVIFLFDFRVALFGLFLYFVLKELRDYYFGGLLFFWQGMAASAIFVAVFGIIVSVLIWIFSINVPGFVSEYVELATNQLKSYPPEVIEQIGKERFAASQAQVKSTTGADLAQLYFRNGMIIGFFISIVLSVILRRQPQNQ
ncbi:MAG TPA: DUF4199 domain-containing protein [Cyclobacteriaceae bacterium]